MTEDRVERLYREQGRRLWAAVLAYTRDRDVADDAVAEAFAQLIRRDDEVRDPQRGCGPPPSGSPAAS